MTEVLEIAGDRSPPTPVVRREPHDASHVDAAVIVGQRKVGDQHERVENVLAIDLHDLQLR
jgi:hypothetical protein